MADPVNTDTSTQPEWATAFITQVTGLLDGYRKDINAVQKSFRTLETKFTAPKPDPDPNPQPDPEPEPKPGDKQAKPDPVLANQLKQLTKQLEDMRKKSEDSEKLVAQERAQRLETERQSLIRSEIADIPFKDDKARQMFFDANIHKITRDEDGNLIANTDTGPISYKDFLKSQVDASPFLLAPKGGGGAGAHAGGRTGGRSRAWTMDDIGLLHTDKLTADQKADLRSFIADSAKSALTGQAQQ